ncbi:MAG: DMT family transporter [Actinomycetota bacterium]|nr:DMT family transporter [Actinomycetota bacterium]
MVVPTVAALSAAALFAVATALLHRSAGLTGRGAAVGHARFVARNARHPMWIAGMVTELAGLGLHALAVHTGPLTLVQPLLVTGLVFALPVRRLLERQRPRRTELLWAGALAAGLAVFLLAATPANGPSSPPDSLPTVISVTAVSAAVATAVVLGLRSSGRRSAAILGFGSGAAFAAVAALLKVVTGELATAGPLATVGSWPLWGLGLAGACGVVLNQLAFRAAPLRYSLPASSTINPLVSLAIGAAVFDEPFRHTVLAVTSELVGLAVVITTVIGLSRFEPDPPPAGVPQGGL